MKGEKKVLSDQWEYMLSLLPEDLDQSARETRAFCRNRHIHSSSDLLRLVLVYCTQGLSFRSVSAWSKQNELAQVSDTDLIKRLRHTPEWLRRLIRQKLAEHVEFPRSGMGRIHLVDGTLVQRPTSHQPDWRIHTS